MRYISWSAFYEGSSDALYFDVLLPRLIRDIVMRNGRGIFEVADVPAVRLGQTGRDVATVAAEACSFKDAYDIVFIHADTGGRSQETGLAQRSNSYCEAMAQACDWPTERCITITPRHETEAWLLADCDAVTSAMGYKGSGMEIGLPATADAAERLLKPKETLAEAMTRVSGKRRSYKATGLFAAIAQRQDLVTLRRSDSFLAFENRLVEGLRSMSLFE